MPQEINKENLAAHVVKMIKECNADLRQLEKEKREARTNERQLHVMGGIGSAKISRLYWGHTAHLFGIEIPTEDEQ